MKQAPENAQEPACLTWMTEPTSCSGRQRVFHTLGTDAEPNANSDFAHCDALKVGNLTGLADARDLTAHTARCPRLPTAGHCIDHNWSFTAHFAYSRHTCSLQMILQPGVWLLNAGVDLWHNAVQALALTACWAAYDRNVQKTLA